MKVRQIYQAMVLCVCFALPSVGSAWGQENCFQASGMANEDAQNIRLLALDMGWEVGKTTSLTAAGIVKGKVKLYPKDAVDVCLRQFGQDELQILAQSRSEDAGKATWHKIPAKRRTREETRI